MFVLFFEVKQIVFLIKFYGSKKMLSKTIL